MFHKDSQPAVETSKNQDNKKSIRSAATEGVSGNTFPVLLGGVTK